MLPAHDLQWELKETEREGRELIELTTTIKPHYQTSHQQPTQWNLHLLRNTTNNLTRVHRPHRQQVNPPQQLELPNSRTDKSLLPKTPRWIRLRRKMRVPQPQHLRLFAAERIRSQRRQSLSVLFSLSTKTRSPDPVVVNLLERAMRQRDKRPPR